MKEKKPKGTELIFGLHPIIELLQAKKRRLSALYTTKPLPKGFNVIEKLLPKGLQLQFVSRDILTKMAGTTDHQGVIGYTTPFIIRKKFFDPEKQPFLVMLDGIQDPRNAGAIIRSAYCTGVDGIIMVQKGSAPITATVLKASVGLAEHSDIYMSPSAAAAVQELKKAGYTNYVSILDAKSKKVNEISFSKPLCIIIGSEGVGVSREAAQAGQHVYIPQRSADISYNASVAAGILLFIAGQQIGTI